MVSRRFFRFLQQLCGAAPTQTKVARLRMVHDDGCHPLLRRTMATQFLNADAAQVTIQDLLGHSRIKTTQRYCRVSNLKMQRESHIWNILPAVGN